MKWNAKISLLILPLFFGTLAFAVDTGPGEIKDSLFQWTAHWIWMDDSVDNQTMLARYSFELQDKPDSASIRITASDRYLLYVNGKYICRGPARSAAHHQSYDILDLADMLHQGKNSFAIRVHHQGRAGLLAQAEIFTDKGSVSIISGQEWKVSPDLSWSNDSPVISRFQDFVNDMVDMRRFDPSWKNTDFDDAGWSSARSLMRDSGWPKPQGNASPQSLTPPWTSLIPRDIPYLIESDVAAKDLLGIYRVDNYLNDIPLSAERDKRQIDEFQRSAGGPDPFIIRAGEDGLSTVLLFDFGEVIIGMPKLDIRGEPGTIVDILCAPYILDNSFTHKIVNTECRDRVILSGNRDLWEATYFKPARYMAVAIRNNTKDITLHSAGMRKIEYPFETQGLINTPGSEWAEQYWEASMKTIRVCTTDGYTDNYRERRQYAQTGYYAALGNYWTFGDHALQRRYLIQIAQEQKANGIMPAYAPLTKEDYMVIFDSNCLWIRSLRNYLLFSGDYITVRQLLPAAEKLMALFHSYTDRYGMINNPPYAYWLDHADIDRRGANLNLNAHYLGALEDFSQVLDWLDEDGSELFESRAELLRESIQQNLWDEDKELFVDALINGERSDQFSEHGNGMALALNIASPEQARSIVRHILKKEGHNYIKRESGLTMVTPAMSYFLHAGLCKSGYVKESFDLFRERFDKMLEPGTNQTLWEEWYLDSTGRTGKLQYKTRSDAQTESAFPPALIAEYLFGIKPLSPGMNEVAIKRVQSDVDQLEGSFPTPQGLLKVGWEMELDSGKLFLSIPGNMKVKLDIKSLMGTAHNSIIINGKEINAAGESKPFFLLQNGDHEIHFFR